MRAQRPHTLRRALAPLGLLLALGLVAGYVLGRDVAASGSPADVRPSAAITSQEPNSTEQEPHSTTSDGAAPASAEARSTARKAEGRHKFLLLQSDQTTPIRWNPCAPITYKVALGRFVPESEILPVRAAFDTVGRALGGVPFLYDGTTDVVPDSIEGAAAAQTDIVFAFATSGAGPEASDLLTGWEAGRGGMAAAGVVRPDGTAVQHPTHGTVVLDVDKWRDMTTHERTILYLHEIGHAVGLDHPQNDRQIMSSGAYDLPEHYQAGDLAGFARLGRQAGCTE